MTNLNESLLQPFSQRQLGFFLISATTKGNVGVVKLLIKMDVDVNAEDITDKTSAQIAIAEVRDTRRINKENHLKILELLLSAGANPNGQYGAGQTLLHQATWSNELKLAKILLEHGANPNARNKDGSIPLLEATKHNKQEVVKILIEHGANINEQDESKRTALHIAAREDYREVAEILLKQGVATNIELRDDHDRTALEIAIREGHYEIADLFWNYRKR